MVKKYTHALLCFSTLISSGHPSHQGPCPEPAQSITLAVYPHSQRQEPTAAGLPLTKAQTEAILMYILQLQFELPHRKIGGLTIQFTFGKKTNRKIQLLFHVWPFEIPYELLSIKNVINSQSLVMIKHAGINPYIVT